MDNKEIIEKIRHEGIPEHLDNCEFKFHFFERDNAMDATAACAGSIENLKDAMRAGVARCIINEQDVDMFVNVEGKTFLPAKKLELIPGITCVMDSVDGNLRFKVGGRYELNVIFSGGANPWLYPVQQPAPAQAPAQAPAAAPAR